MAFTGLDSLLPAMTSGSYPVTLNKGTIATQVLGSEASLWRGVGYPVQAAIPSEVEICSDATLGALPLAARAGAAERLITSMGIQMATLGNTLYTEDRLAHMAGLLGNTTIAQTVGIDLDANLAVSNLAERIGRADYSEVQWFLEWYVATGSTATTPTVDVTYHDGTTGTCNIWVAGLTALPATVGASRRYAIKPTNGKFIRSVESVTLSLSTGTVGNFGVTALRRKARLTCMQALGVTNGDWASLNAPLIHDNSCLMFGMLCATTSTGLVSGELVQGVA